MEKIKVIIADDHMLFCEGLRTFVEKEEDMECVAIAKDGVEATRLVEELLPDVILIDIDMPKMDGIEAARKIKIACPGTAVIIVSAYKYAHYILASIEVGVDGYLMKHIPRSELINAIRVVHSGQGVFSIEATGRILQGVAADGYKCKEMLHPSNLTRRELDILKMIARGITNKEIAHKVGLSNHTVNTHLVHIFRKLGVYSRTEATLYTLKEGLIRINDLTLER